MILTSGTKYRSIAGQNKLNFYFDISISNTSGYSEIGLSGAQGPFPLFYFSSGNILDFNLNHVWSYSPRDTISLSGNISSEYINYFINNKPVCFDKKNNYYFDNLYISTKNAVIDSDLYISALKPNYSITFPKEIFVGNQITGYLTNLENILEKSFKIFSGQIFGENGNFNLNNFQKSIISGTQSGSIIIDSLTLNVLEDTDSIFDLVLDTNFGKISERIDFILLPAPIYFTDFQEGFTGIIGLPENFDIRKIYNFELRSIYPVNRNFIFKLENAAGHNNEIFNADFNISGNISGIRDVFVHGIDYIYNTYTTTGISNIVDYYGNTVTGEIESTDKILAFATGDVNYYYNLPLLGGSGTGIAPLNTVIIGSGISNIPFSGFIFGNGIYTGSISNFTLTGYYFNSINIKTGINLNIFNTGFYTGNWNVSYNNLLWESNLVTGFNYSGYSNKIYGITGFLSGIISENQFGVNIINRTIFVDQKTGLLLREIVKQNSGIFIISGASISSENTNLSNLAFTGDSYLYLKSGTGFITYQTLNYNLNDKGRITHYTFNVDYNAEYYPYIFSLQLSTNNSSWTTIDTVTGYNFYDYSDYIFNCKNFAQIINNNVYSFIRLLITSGKKWDHKFINHNVNQGVGIKNLEFYKNTRVEILDSQILDIVPSNITNYSSNFPETISINSFYGDILYSNDSNQYPAWYAFNNNKNLYPYGQIELNSLNQLFLGYVVENETPIIANGFFIEFEPNFKPSLLILEGSTNGSSYSKLYEKLNDINDIESGVFSNTPGSNWLEIGDTTNDWSTIFMSKNGQRQYAITFDGNVFYSNNFGNNWEQNFILPTKNWIDGSLSEDGKLQLLTAFNDNIFISNDYGNTWIENTGIGRKFWTSVSMSNDGKIQAVTALNDYIYISTDSGINWLASIDPGIKDWKSIDVSNNGKVITAGAFDSNIWISVNSGNNWIEKTGAGQRNWQQVVNSYDGKYQSAIAYNQNIWISSDTGNSWVERTAPGRRQWESIGISSDGKIYTAIANNSNIWYSTNFGNNWQEVQNFALNWYKLDMSYDGKIQTAVGFGNNIFSSISNDIIFTGYYLRFNFNIPSQVSSSSSSSLPEDQINTQSIFAGESVNQSYFAGTSLNISKDGLICAIGEMFGSPFYKGCVAIYKRNNKESLFNRVQYILGNSSNQNYGGSISLTEDGSLLSIGLNRTTIFPTDLANNITLPINWIYQSNLDKTLWTRIESISYTFISDLNNSKIVESKSTISSDGLTLIIYIIENNVVIDRLVYKNDGTNNFVNVDTID